ncbi:MAG TPA: hypothetical protein VG095_07795, partial [Chthoniobacterales bacterium]|nr:hypothetical protein [Chthoniobacterales bacterium]
MNTPPDRSFGLQTRSIHKAFAALAFVACFFSAGVPRVTAGDVILDIMGYFSDFLPPRNGEYFHQGDIHYPNVILRNGFLSRPTFSRPPPGQGGASDVICEATFRIQRSTDGGNTFSLVTATARLHVKLFWSSQEADGTRVYDTEMLQLDVAGGNLPAGWMIRESPTLASKGRVAVSPGPDDTYRIASFFDVFTELSVDGGQNFNPAGQWAHLELRRLPQEHFFPTNFLPPRGQYEQSPPAQFAQTGDGLILGNLLYLRSDTPFALPPPGIAHELLLEDLVRLQRSTDGGNTFQTITAPAQTRVAIGDLNRDGVYEMEVRELNAMGGNFGALRLRESPTLSSLGRTNLRMAPGGFMIDSFFDVFIELSVNDGQSWTPADQPARLELLPAVQKVPVPTEFFPPRADAIR